MKDIRNITSITVDGITFPAVHVYFGFGYERKKIIVPNTTTILEIITAFNARFVNHWTIPSINGNILAIEDLVRPLSDFDIGNECFIFLTRKAFNL